MLWRQHDIFMTSFGGRDLYSGQPVNSVDEIVARTTAGPGTKLLVLPPLIHGAAQWTVMTALTTGQTVVFASVVDHLDPRDVVRTIERERVSVVTVVGNAIARPLVASIEKGTADVSSLVAVANGGALLTPYVKQRLIAALPNAVIIDGVGSSETGAQMHHLSASGAISTGTFNAGPDINVAAEDLSAILPAGHEGIGWLAQRGYVPLGYKGDAAKTATTFPVINGVRYAVPGDRARHRADGCIELLGRDSATINSGGRRSSPRRSRPRSRPIPRSPTWWSPDAPANAGARKSSPWSRSTPMPLPMPKNWSRMPRNRWRGTSFPKRSCSGPGSNAVRPAKPTTDGQRSRRLTASQPYCLL
ncbi:long-chain-fatty-acid--CoA ligase FadD19 [Mycobacterium ulcerans str. Harvey]|uniref:Long-chain-fatty-acid--CoA ligase FadD19 n=1 Tax=Mycobacterium ulcerans str. Harvey TaxID=1299332 RepID=A0ABN0QRL3_MYCUL|nr:long-chain-fatty-acid--CoA ligase FadD19 [Mycobacterium ulcerans str. Harvey]